MDVSRYLERSVEADLSTKMVFVAGPRQVGKTTLARHLLAADPQGLYLSWDRRQDRSRIRRANWPAESTLVVLDELHKLSRWKRWIKGEYDHHGGRIRFLITGSARLDVYRRGGDSLQGRYHHYRLHPLSCAELLGVARPGAITPGAELPIPSATHEEGPLHDLQHFGGFPEPFLAATDRTLRRWQKERLDRFFREDVRDLENVRDLSALEILADLLVDRVGSPLSINSLREDLEVSHRTASRWIDILERLYHVFRVPPHVVRSGRGLKRMPKAYLWDSSLVSAPGARFENLIALHLLKLCHYLTDAEGYRVELRYLRDVTGREVDFLVTADREPWFAVECKLSQGPVDRSLHYYRERLKIPWCYQVALDGSRDVLDDGVRCLSAEQFLRALV